MAAVERRKTWVRQAIVNVFKEPPVWGHANSATPHRATGFSLREFTKATDATAILASRGLKPAAQMVARVLKLRIRTGSTVDGV